MARRGAVGDDSLPAFAAGVDELRAALASCARERSIRCEEALGVEWGSGGRTLAAGAFGIAGDAVRCDFLGAIAASAAPRPARKALQLQGDPRR
jgi:hypothetical protein